MSVNRARSKKELDKAERDAKRLQNLIKYQEELRKFDEIIKRQNKRYEKILKEHNEGQFRRTGSAESPEDYKAHAGRAAKPSKEKPETNKRGIECPPDTPLSKCT